MIIKSILFLSRRRRSCLSSQKGIGVRDAWTPLIPTPPPQLRLSNIFLFSPPVLFC